MILTPLGPIRLLADGVPVEYEAEPAATRQPNLAGCLRIRTDGAGVKELRCVLENKTLTPQSSSGEGCQAVEFADGKRILTIGTETYHPVYSTIPGPDGITVALNGSGGSVTFGIAWAEDYAGDSDVRTWLAADPTLD